MVDATTAIGALDVAGGITMLWAFQRITSSAGVRTRAARWALFRRVVYASMAVSLFGLGVDRLDGDLPVRPTEAFFQGTLIVGIMIFPLLRAVGWISQDRLLATDGFVPFPAEKE